MDADGTDQTQALFLAAGDPSFSPDGSRLVFVRSTPMGGVDIFVADVDGLNETRLTSDPAHDFQPAFSADGSKIVFTRVPEDSPFCLFLSETCDAEIYIMNSDGSGQTNLTNDPARDQDPSISPDGSRIAFASDRQGDPDVLVMNIDGTGADNLTVLPAMEFIQDRQPSFSPDGKKIAFATDRDGNPEIYVMNADGSAQTRVTSWPDVDEDPDWGSRPPSFIDSDVYSSSLIDLIVAPIVDVSIPVPPSGSVPLLGLDPIRVVPCSSVPKELPCPGITLTAPKLVPLPSFPAASWAWATTVE